MKCREAERHLPGYMDGTIEARHHSMVSEHLEDCDDCRVQLERYRRLSICLASLEPAPVPPDLALQIRVKASQFRPVPVRLRAVWERFQLACKNIIEPLAVPATGGIATALIAFVLVVQNILVGVPLGRVVQHDQPLNFIQQARVENLAPLPMPSLVSTDDQNNSGALMLEATLNSRGEVVSYEILSGPKTPAMQQQINQVLIFSKFSPKMGFGRPMNGGRVVLGFSEIRVRG
jgi:Putative zinc-finger